MNRWFLDLFWTVCNRYWNRITILPEKKEEEIRHCKYKLVLMGVDRTGRWELDRKRLQTSQWLQDQLPLPVDPHFGGNLGEGGGGCCCL